MPGPKWYVDRSRYEKGFACPFSRLLQYHAGGTGWTPRVEATELAVGSAIHSLLETILKEAKSTNQVPSRNWFSLMARTGIMSLAALQSVEIVGIAVGWARANLGWLLDNYEILEVEGELSIDIGDDITWMARPDAVLRSKATGLPCVLEFKTTRANVERMAQLYSNSLQSIMNAYAVSSKYGQPCGEVQIHMLQLGNEQWPTPITHAYYRPGQPPFVTEDWQPKSRRPDGTYVGKLYRKVAVHEHRPILDWIFSMPAAALTALVPLTKLELDPKTQGLKTLQAISSIRANESWWRDTLAKVDWQSSTFADLAKLVPRSFNCHSYNRLCEYTPTCFDPDNHTLTFETPTTGLVIRTPHHTQERNK